MNGCEDLQYVRVSIRCLPLEPSIQHHTQPKSLDREANTLKGCRRGGESDCVEGKAYTDPAALDLHSSAHRRNRVKMDYIVSSKDKVNPAEQRITARHDDLRDGGAGACQCGMVNIEAALRGSKLKHIDYWSIENMSQSPSLSRWPPIVHN